MPSYFARRFNKAFTLTFSTVLAVMSLPSAQAAAFPEKPIRFVVPFSPGGGTDLVARTLGAEMSKDLGQPVVIENKPGASTVIGTDTVAKAEPDGYTLVISTAAHAVNPSLMAKLPYNTDKDFAPVILIARSPNILVVRPNAPYKSVKDILVAASAKPGVLTFASQGSGTSAHLAGELFKHLGKVDMIHVPYKGAGPALTDLLGGQVDMMFATAAAVGGFLDSGKLRALAVTTADRSPAHPELPTVAEAGLTGFVADSWYGMYAPAGTPPEVIARLNAAAKKAAQSETFRNRVQPEGLMINAGTPEAYDQYVRGEIDRWAKVIKAAHITTN